jgi:hypothetical protein
MGLLCEVLVEDSAPEHDDMRVDRSQAGRRGRDADVQSIQMVCAATLRCIQGSQEKA